MASLKWNEYRAIFTNNHVWVLELVMKDNHCLVAGKVHEDYPGNSGGCSVKLFVDELGGYYERAKTLEEAKERLTNLVLDKLFEEGDAYVSVLERRARALWRASHEF